MRQQREITLLKSIYCSQCISISLLISFSNLIRYENTENRPLNKETAWAIAALFPSFLFLFSSRTSLPQHSLKNTIPSHADLIRNQWSNKFIRSNVCFNLAVRRTSFGGRTRRYTHTNAHPHATHVQTRTFHLSVAIGGVPELCPN